MNSSLSYLLKLRDVAVEQNCRFGVVLEQDTESAYELCLQFIESAGIQHVFALGTQLNSVSVVQVESHQGHQFLGRECQILIWNLAAPWDANSFSSALGTLRGGGLVLFVARTHSSSLAQTWLNAHLSELFQLGPYQQTPLPKVEPLSERPSLIQQQQAVELIKKVVTGHRKRPLVLTADRGRGKTSALGIASAQLMQERPIKIVVTAPAAKAVQPLYQHLTTQLTEAQRVKDQVTFHQSSLVFMAPDSILRDKPECDLLIVDEAAALPIPMLQALVEHYHRMVFSSTINGYEGCGRGFTLKFQAWLTKERPGYNTFHMDQPIRWAINDPLEQWQRDAFLLDYELAPLSVEQHQVQYHLIDKQNLVAKPELLQSIFSILVNAHYQTSPNDLFQLLADPDMVIWVAQDSHSIVGCLLAVKEGGLNPEMVEQICQGKRRPKGHLAAISIANQMGITAAAEQTSYRVMRVAVHPDAQRMSIGSSLLNQFCLNVKADFFSTSFGATDSLVEFWHRNGFDPVRLGTKRDQASGCYSLLMVKSDKVDWLEQAKALFYQHLLFELSDNFKQLETDLIRWCLMQRVHHGKANKIHERLIGYYVQGGGNFESCAFIMAEWLLGLPSEQWASISNLLIAKVLQKWSWQECASSFSLSGRKQVENKLREELKWVLDNLHCKVIN